MKSLFTTIDEIEMEMSGKEFKNRREYWFALKDMLEENGVDTYIYDTVLKSAKMGFDGIAFPSTTSQHYDFIERTLNEWNINTIYLYESSSEMINELAFYNSIGFTKISMTTYKEERTREVKNALKLERI